MDLGSISAIETGHIFVLMSPTRPIRPWLYILLIYSIFPLGLPSVLGLVFIGWAPRIINIYLLERGRTGLSIEILRIKFFFFMEFIKSW